jgi:hypothetical protein
MFIQGPKYNGYLTTSFEDIVLVPLPCWIFFLSLVQLFVANRRKHASPAAEASENQTTATSQNTNVQTSRMKTFVKRLIRCLLILFAFGVLLLTIDELARLSSLSWGVGLLPFVPITATIATGLHLARNKLNSWYPHEWDHRALDGQHSFKIRLAGSFRSDISLRTIPFWLGMIVVEAIKLHTLIRLEGPFPRKSSKYPTSQQVLDIAVLLVCMVLVMLLTLFELVFLRRE